jgi:hypothetical protein
MAPSQDNSDHSSAADTDLWVFRDGRKPQQTRQLVEELQHVLRKLSGSPSDLELDALIRAGELESALADCDSPYATPLGALTETLAARVCGNQRGRSRELHLDLGPGALPYTVTVSPPEGFSYYALQPLDFAAVALHCVRPGDAVAVIGIRSIGTTLSAIVKAALEARGCMVGRITVRPTGHPYDRRIAFDAQQREWVEKHSGSAKFLVIDEGPGRSGSTFLSVAEALVSAGIDQERITLVGSREADPEALCASAAAVRWNKFKFLAAANQHSRFHDCSYIGSGEWRRVFMPQRSAWPACWPQMERLKFLSEDRKLLYKFEGLGRVGDAVRNRAGKVAEAGFGCPVQDAGDGFSAYTVIPRSALTAQDLSSDLLERIAQYCAFRASEFSASGLRPDALAEMLRFNLQRELHIDFEPDGDLLACPAPVFADARMQPWEWIGGGSEVLKTDVSTHGDDHFFPGPTDITWDLAGAAVEWNMDRNAVEFLLTRFHNLTGLDVKPRFGLFRLTYNVVQMAYSKMAISTVAGTEEEPRLQEAYRRYRMLIREQITDSSGEEKNFRYRALQAS